MCFQYVYKSEIFKCKPALFFENCGLKLTKGLITIFLFKMI